MPKPPLDFRTLPRTLSTTDRVTEWKRLGFKVSKANAAIPKPLLDSIEESYLEGSGTKYGSTSNKPLNKKWVPPTELHPLQKAFINHADEELADISIDWSYPEPYLCYLIKEGFAEPDGWRPIDLSLIEVKYKVWVEICQKAIASQKNEGVFLNPRTLSVLSRSLILFNTLTSHKVGETYEYKIIKKSDEASFPIGPGYEGFLPKLSKWVENKPADEIKELATEQGSILNPWILENSKLSNNVKGLNALLPLLKTLDDDEVTVKTNTESLLKNKHLDTQGREILTEWALTRALAFQEGADISVRQIFMEFAKNQGQLSSMQQSRIILGLGDRIDQLLEDRDSDEEVHEDDLLDGQEYQEDLLTFAMIPWVSQEPEIRDKLLLLENEDIMLEMFFHATGPTWLDLAKKLAKATNIGEEEYLDALKYASSKNLTGLKRTDLSALLKSPSKEVRTQIIRLAALAPEDRMPAR